MSVTVNNAYMTYGTVNAEQAAAMSRKSAEKKDTTETGGAAKDFNSLMQAVIDSPDLQSDKVADIKSRFAMGSYNVSSSAVANKILGEYYKANG